MVGATRGSIWVSQEAEGVELWARVFIVVSMERVDKAGPRMSNSPVTPPAFSDFQGLDPCPYLLWFWKHGSFSGPCEGNNTVSATFPLFARQRPWRREGLSPWAVPLLPCLQREMLMGTPCLPTSWGNPDQLGGEKKEVG